MVSNTRSQRVPMSAITALTLHKDRLTTGRRSSPVPQLTCKGSPCRSFQPQVVQCLPVGTDGTSYGVEWKCEAELPSGITLGAVEVGCEGWDGPEDPYILKGSCGLTYNLVRSSNQFDSPYSSYSLPSKSFFSNIPWTNILTSLLFFYAVYIFFRSFLPSLNRNTNPAARRGGSNWFGGGGGGGGGGGPGFGGGRGPPPPYSKTAPSAPESEAWRPGFWSGLAAGAAALRGADYLRNRNQPQPRMGGMGMGMGLGGGRRFDDDWDRGVGGSGSWGTGGGAGPSSGGGSLRPSTGFGGTRNR